MQYKISIIGMGYVGCGNALMLSKNHEVSVVDIDQNKIDNFNNKELPIDDSYAQKFFTSQKLNVSATSILDESIEGASFIIISLPTDFDKKTKSYNTSLIEDVIKKIIDVNSDALIIIKSTVNIGYTDSLCKRFDTKRIIFSPEFLREGHALEDNLYPSRIIIGGTDERSKLFGNILRQSSNNLEASLIFMGSTEAEAVKLFSNTYLAMRVAYFNELDGFCLDNKINTSDVIKGVSLDNRIGDFYNNPSFGFGGYCLPKDSKQLLTRFGDLPNSLIEAIQKSNFQRTKFLAQKIIIQTPKIVGVYKLAMKEGSDNSRDSSIFGIIDELVKNNIKVIIYDESVQGNEVEIAPVEKDFKKFTHDSDCIITNRLDKKIKPFISKIFTRDIFSSDE
jgi:UDPglucose 6-dehydrogenase